MMALPPQVEHRNCSPPARRSRWTAAFGGSKRGEGRGTTHQRALAGVLGRQRSNQPAQDATAHQTAHVGLYPFLASGHCHYQKYVHTPGFGSTKGHHKTGVILGWMARSRSSPPLVRDPGANGHATLPRPAVRNPGIPLDRGWVGEARFTNRSATERRAATLPARRSVKKAWQAAWLLRAITCIDLTTLLGDDTPGTVRRLSAKARQPVRHDILELLGVGHLRLTVGAVNATLPVSLTMVRAIRDYRERTGFSVGFEPAGGVRSAKQALDWMALMKEELGDPWLRSDLFRFGASGLLTDIERQLWHNATGRYSATHHHPMP